MKSKQYALPIRWGIIGCGDVTEVKSGPGFREAAGSELVAVMRRNSRLAEDYARRHQVAHWYDDADALIDDPEVDAVYVATPVGSHRDYALRVCAMGKPVYVEKPMARQAAECREMVAAFEKAGLPLFVAYYRRQLPRFLKVRELLEAAAVGTITGVISRLAMLQDRNPDAHDWRLTAEQGGGGRLMDMGSHALDIIDFLFGPLAEVSGLASNHSTEYQVEDSTAFHFRAGDIPGVGLWNFATALEEDVLDIYGTEGRIRLSVFGNEPVRLEKPEGLQEFDLPNPKHVQQPLIQSVVDDLVGRGICPSTGETASRTNQVLDTVLGDYYGGRDDAFWSRPDTWPGLKSRR